jgi:hypothetical protein
MLGNCGRRQSAGGDRDRLSIEALAEELEREAAALSGEASAGRDMASG